MVNELIMRSVYLTHKEDAALRQLALRLNVTKSDLIRTAVCAKIDEWFDLPDQTRKLKEYQNYAIQITSEVERYRT